MRVMIFFLSFILLGCTVEQAQRISEGVNKVNYWQSQGYDLDCAELIDDMVKKGQLTPEQGRFMMYDKCRRTTQQFQPRQPGALWACPFCGGSGFEIARVRATGMSVSDYVCTYKCARGHTWQKECF